MTPVELKVGSTRVSVVVDFTTPAAAGIQYVTRRLLTDFVYDPRRLRYVSNKKYTHFEPSTSTLYFPVNALPEIEDSLAENMVPVVKTEEPFQPARDLTIHMKDSFVPREHQVKAIEYLKNAEPKRKGLAIQTGSGKTVSAIAGMIAYGKVGMIAVSRLHQQWVRSLLEFTTIREDQLYIVQGYQSLVRLMESEAKPEVIVFSLETLREYCKHKDQYQDLPAFQQFVDYFGIGTKIFDEVHLNFHACTQIDLSCNIPNNIYLTATFTSGNASTRKVFNLVYPESMQFGRDEIKKYTDAYFYSYYGDVPARACMRLRGYNHNKYEAYLLKRPVLLKGYFENIIAPLFNSYYVEIKHENEKVVIFFNMLDMVDAALKWVRSTYPNYKSVMYIGGVNDDVLADNEVIITTPKSCGCGTDIKGLRTVINTVSTKSPTAVLQIFGRLRELPGDDPTIYVDLCDKNLEAHLRHQQERRGWLYRVARSITNRDI